MTVSKNGGAGTRATVVLFIAIVSLSCRPSAKPAERPKAETAAAQPSTSMGAVSVAIVADSHFTNLTGYRAIESMSCAADEQVASAIRPPLLDLWAPTVLRFAINDLGPGSTGHPNVLIHLGDASTISCTGEFERFAGIMNERLARRWFMAPGNHDSFLMGNFAYGPPDLCSAKPNDKACRKTWAAACSDGTDARRDMFKVNFLRHYLAALGFSASDIPETGDFARSGMTDFGPLERVFFGNRDIAGEPNNNAPHGQHFLVQQIALSPKIVGVHVTDDEIHLIEARLRISHLSSVARLVRREPGQPGRRRSRNVRGTPCRGAPCLPRCPR